jgi:hypothetical protein
MKEWTESIFFSTTLDNGRIFDGSAYDTSTISDIISFREAEFPSFALGNYGFRIAAAIPSPNTGIALGALFFIALRRRRVTP